MPVDLAIADAVATVRIDDGKRNALSLGLIGELDAAFTQAEAQAAAIVVGGRGGTFSAGFDLATLSAGPAAAAELAGAGFALLRRMLSSPRPVVVACTGHALAMGAVLLLAADHRVGAAGEYRIGLPEVAVGLAMPYTALHLVTRRVSPAYRDRVVTHAETFDPRTSCAVGFLDSVADGDVYAAAAGVAARLGGLPATPLAVSKARLNAEVLAGLEGSIPVDLAASAGAVSVAEPADGAG